MARYIDDIKTRFFIVGCSRSGTTVLQVSVASHSRIESFPETDFFIKATGKRRKVLARLGLTTRLEKEALRGVLAEVDRPDLQDRVPHRPLLFRTSVRAFTGILDTLAREAGKDCWVEKTPLHVHHVDLMQRYVPCAHFIHMVRDGRDVVASICDRAHKRPERFDREQQDPAFGVARWNRAVNASLPYLGQARHSFVLYESFVNDPARVMKRLCRETGLAYDEQMATGSRSVAQRVVPEKRTWIHGAKEPPRPQPSKFDKLFDRDTQERITRALDLNAYEHIETALQGNDEDAIAGIY